MGPHAGPIVGSGWSHLPGKSVISDFSANEVDVHVPVADAEKVGSQLTDGSAPLLDRLLEANIGGAGFRWPDQVIDYVRMAAWSRGVWVAARMLSRRGGSVETTSTGEGPR
jgi:hypothetical protein